MECYRHGDVLLIKLDDKVEIKGTKKDNLVLAEGEVTGHLHKIIEGDAALFSWDEDAYGSAIASLPTQLKEHVSSLPIEGAQALAVESETARLWHDEHAEGEIVKGNYMVIIQREYDDSKEWRYVAD